VANQVQIKVSLNKCSYLSVYNYIFPLWC